MKKTLLSLLLFATFFSFDAFAKPKDFKLLYWNIQNGMWCDQENNYDTFVKYVKSFDPDICVWAEAKSIFVNGTDRKADRADCYLPGNWDMLAERYGHKYVYLGGERDNYPQVITSKFPIKNVKRICGVAPKNLVAHGAGWAQIELNGKVINIVTLHTWPHPFACYIDRKDKEALEKDKAEFGGDKYRAMEMEMICDATINTQEGADKQYWMMMGDFNSKSDFDNDTYGLPLDSPKFLVHKYIHEHTPYIDAVYEFNNHEFRPSCYGKSRIDYIYMTKPMYDNVSYIDILTPGEPWDRERIGKYCGVNNFYYPSDHKPIFCKFTVK